MKLLQKYLSNCNRMLIIMHEVLLQKRSMNGNQAKFSPIENYLGKCALGWAYSGGDLEFMLIRGISYIVKE